MTIENIPSNIRQCRMDHSETSREEQQSDPFASRLLPPLRLFSGKILDSNAVSVQSAVFVRFVRTKYVAEKISQKEIVTLNENLTI